MKNLMNILILQKRNHQEDVLENAKKNTKNFMIPRSKGHKMYVYIHFYDLETYKT